MMTQESVKENQLFEIRINSVTAADSGNIRAETVKFTVTEGSPTFQELLVFFNDWNKCGATISFHYCSETKEGYLIDSDYTYTQGEILKHTS